MAYTSGMSRGQLLRRSSGDEPMHSIQSDKAHVTLGKFSSLNSELKLEDFPKVHEERSCTSCSHAARSD